MKKCVKNRKNNKLTKRRKTITFFFKLPHTEKYSGYSFRGSAATLLIDAGGAENSSAEVEGYIDNQNICTHNQHMNLGLDSIPTINLTNCSSISMNININ